jgi:hypothetical protein
MHTGFWWESEGKRPIGRPRNRWINNTKTGPRKIAYVGMDWTDLAMVRGQRRALMNMTMNLWLK